MRAVVALIFSTLAVLSSSAAEAVSVVVSTRPVQAVAQEVMKGIATPQLLLASPASLHTHTLIPSEAKLLAGADIVFWIGPSLEAFLEKPLRSLAAKAQLVGLLGAGGIETLPMRVGGLWEEAAPNRPHSAIPDGHIWLDPRNAVAMANAIAETLAVVDPAHAEGYWANAESFSRSAMAMDKELHVRLAGVRDKPFLVFHDATQYFEARYGLAALGSVSVTPDQPPGARRLTAIQERVREVTPVCIFSEPQFEPRTVQMLGESTGARTGVVDPEGTSLADGDGLYFALMRRLADEFTRCLK